MTDAQMRIQELERLVERALFKKRLTTRKCVDADPAGNTYEIDWDSETVEIAKKANIDLTKHETYLDYGGEW